MTANMPEPQLIQYIQIDHFPGKQIFVNEKDALEAFSVKRIYWINYQNNQDNESEHAHKTLNQIIIAISGTVNITLESPSGRHYQYTLDTPSQGLYIPAMYWKNIAYTSPCILLCFASESYDESDYIRDYDTYKRLSKS